MKSFTRTKEQEMKRITEIFVKKFFGENYNKIIVASAKLSNEFIDELDQIPDCKSS